MADAEEVEAKLDDLKAAAQVVESIGDLIEASKSTAEQAIEKEFASIFAELESREEQLLKRAKADPQPECRSREGDRVGDNGHR